MNQVQDATMSASLSLPADKYESTIFVCTAHVHNISQKLQTFYEDEDLCDIVLIADTDKIQLSAHRIVLSASSDYFLAMFRSSLKEAKANEVTIKDISGETLKTLLSFMYTGRIELRCETVETIIKAADFFQMRTLIGACCDFIEQGLDTTNCLGIASFSEQHNYTELNEGAVLFALQNFEEVSTQNEFFQLSKDEICKLISSDDLNVSSEEEVFLSVIAWVDYDNENREKYILEILPMVRFTSLEPKFIVENRHSVCKTMECYELICSWLQWHLCPDIRQQSSLMVTQPRKVQKRKLAFISGKRLSDLKLQTFDPEAKSWSYTTIPLPEVNKYNHKITYFDHKLIVTGGTLAKFKRKTVECFNLLTNEWTSLSPMGSARSRHEATVINGHLYVLGGCKTGTSVEKYDFATDKWEYLESLPNNFVGAIANGLRGHLYVINSEKMLCYDAVANKWIQKFSTKTNISGFTSAEVCGELYAVGGAKNGDDYRTVECYNFFTDDWEEIKPLKVKRHVAYCTEFNDRIIVAGGYTNENKGFTDVVEEYDPENDEWIDLAPLLPHSSSYYSDLLFTI